MKKIGYIIIAILVLVAVNALAEDLECRIVSIDDEKILAEFWHNDRYYYVVEFDGRTRIIDAYLNYYYEIFSEGFDWNQETMELEKCFDDEWYVQENILKKDEGYILLGFTGGDAGEFKIPVLWAIGN